MSSREVEWSVYYLPASHMPLLPSPGLLAGQSIPPQMASLFFGTFVSMLKLSISVDLCDSGAVFSEYHRHWDVGSWGGHEAPLFIEWN